MYSGMFTKLIMSRINKKYKSARKRLKRKVLTSGSSLVLLFFMGLILSCINKETVGDGDDGNQSEITNETGKVYGHLTTDDFVRDIVNHP